MDQLLQAIQKFGFNQYESKAYVSLVKLGMANAYQVSKDSGVPRARIYEILKTLVTRGIVLQIEKNEEILYQPLPVDVFLQSAQNQWETSFQLVEEGLKKLEQEVPTKELTLTTIKDKDKILTFCRSLIANAKNQITVSLWDNMYDQLEDDLKAKQQDCSIKGIVFKRTKLLPGLEPHRETKFINELNENKWFILSIDRKHIFYGHSILQGGNAFYTEDPVHAYLFEDYIWHDILVNRLVNKSSEDINKWIDQEVYRFFHQ
ncbi:TrmB family transcriptional regulator [Shimazuella kribbensis]|uniref:TrmB family transcriptional regulator n=1 Tax=Shimazuella kribbensis TaxID=139808 RepID=UPI0004116F5C|nr:helix-turn-helix domain-containing protein [Shimazuella kribbensis]